MTDGFRITFSDEREDVVIPKCSSFYQDGYGDYVFQNDEGKSVAVVKRDGVSTVLREA